jgi:hypothetical protein
VQSKSAPDVRRRVSYFISRLVRLNTGNMVAKAGEIGRLIHRPTIFILADMAWCAVRYEAGYYDYHEFEYWFLNGRERKTVLTRPRANNLVQKLNPPQFRYKLSDKSVFNQLFAPYLGRDWMDVRTSSVDELRSFVVEHGRVMAKVTQSVAGKGIQKLEASDITDYELLRRELLEHQQYLVEEYVTQHPVMASLSPTSVNTLRMISYFDGTDVHILARVLKMGSGAEIDNFSSGGMYTTLDEHGVAAYPAFDKAGASFSVQPQTGTSIVGFQVPLFPEVLAFVDEIARVVPEVPYVGWDIAITPEKPIVIEGNYNTGVFWMKPSLSGIKTGLLPLYREVIGF